ncbi:unnamed protein product, partial [Brassica rapa subsp. narinosa]
NKGGKNRIRDFLAVVIRAPPRRDTHSLSLSPLTAFPSPPLHIDLTESRGEALDEMTEKEIRPIKLKASLALKKHGEGNSSSSGKALVKVKLEKDKHVSSDDGSSSGKALVTVKLEKEESEVLVASGVMKRKRISRLVEKSRRFSAKSESSLDKQKTCHRRGMTTRWNTERIDKAERALFEILKEKGASFERPVPRAELRVSARRRIGDTGLLDHLLKHIDGNVTPGGAERFRRCHNTEGTMQYWLESADLIKIKLESGVCDSNWAPPSWWKLPNVNNIIKLEPGVLDPSESPAKLKEEMDKMRSEIKELVSDLALIKRESGIPDLDSIPLAQWKIQSSSKESSAVSSKLREEIDKMKSDLKKHISKPELPNNADANEKLIKDFMSWRVKTEKQIAEISNSLASTQCMVKELVSWKDKVEKQLVGISNSQNGRQANGSNSFSPDPQSWEHLLHSANLDDFTGDGFEPWDVDTDLIDALPDAEAVRPDTYLLPPNARKSSLQDHMWFEEQSVLNSEMQRTESCMTRGDSRSSNQDKAELTPGSSMTAGPRSDIEDPNIISQETLKELVSWKAKAEQQLMEIFFKIKLGLAKPKLKIFFNPRRITRSTDSSSSSSSSSLESILQKGYRFDSYGFHFIVKLSQITNSPFFWTSRVTKEEEMEEFVDHYIVLGLPSGEEAQNLSEKEISKAYRLKALDLHPDKRRDDPDAHEKFQRLKTSYEVLKDEKARKLFDDLLRIQRERQHKKSQVDSKRRKMMSDLEERERNGFAPSHAASRPYDEEERIARKLKEEVDRIRAQHAKKRGGFETPPESGGGDDGKRREDRSGGGASAQLDKERVLKVSWETIGEGYSAGRLREVFSEFGEVEDVVIRSTKKKCSALIVMATKDGAVAATRTLCGDLSNPLLVVPLQRAAQTDFSTAKKSAEAEPQSNIVGAGYQAYEDQVMERLKKKFWGSLFECFIRICLEPALRYTLSCVLLLYPESEIGIFRKILQGKLNFETNPWPSISESAKDLIKKMLESNPKKRLTAHQVLCHPWIVDDTVAPDKPLDCAVVSRLKKFSAMNKLKKMALRVIAERLSEEEIGGLKEMFKMIDTDDSGTITFEELKDSMKRVGSELMESEIQELLHAADVDESGTIDYGEFLAATIHLNKLEREENLVAAFSFFDKDASGYITIDELQQAWKEFGINDSHLDEMIKDIDQDNDGQIDYGEFVAMMRKGNGNGGIGRRTMRNTLSFENPLPDESING